MSKIKALLLDLDGTLLNVDMYKFIPAYIQSLIPWIKDYIPPENFAEALMASTARMVADTNPELTNEQVFYRDFCRRVGHPAAVLQPIFESYYREGYPALKKLAAPNPEAAILLETARKANIKLVLATNPVFPESAVRQRMEWGKLESYPFELVTFLENMHFCKPRPEYYREILDKIGLSPAECLMAGNDVGEDIVPSKSLGMKTFLVTGTLMINETGAEPRPDAEGTLSHLAKMLY